DAILLSSDRYSKPDSLYGHGIPDALKADSILRSWPMTSITNEQALEVSVYPNPSYGIIKIHTEPGAKYQLINTQGAIKKEGTLHNWINFLDIKELREGVYFLKVRYKLKQTTLKLLVN
ncbi:MAG: T9SS type A sorting domain-containing protein, partial [Bacteroidia bacterium]